MKTWHKEIAYKTTNYLNKGDEYFWRAKDKGNQVFYIQKIKSTLFGNIFYSLIGENLEYGNVYSIRCFDTLPEAIHYANKYVFHD